MVSETHKEYVLVHQNERKIELFSRRDGWKPRTAGTGELIDIRSIDVQLAVDEMYCNDADSSTCQVNRGDSPKRL